MEMRIPFDNRGGGTITNPSQTRYPWRVFGKWRT